MAAEIKVRYSDADLAEFKLLIQEKIEHAQHDLELIKSAYLNDGNNGIIKEYSNDGVHLTEKGYRVLEPLLEKALEKVLN